MVQLLLRYTLRLFAVFAVLADRSIQSSETPDIDRRVLNSRSVLSPRVSAELIERYSFGASAHLPVSTRFPDITREKSILSGI